MHNVNDCSHSNESPKRKGEGIEKPHTHTHTHREQGRKNRHSERKKRWRGTHTTISTSALILPSLIYTHKRVERERRAH